MGRTKEKIHQTINAVAPGPDTKSKSRLNREAEIAERPKKRRIDLNSLRGVARFHAQLMRAVDAGGLNLLVAETQSRMCVRHKDILTAIEQGERIVAIEEQLKRINSGNPPGQEFLLRPDDLDPEAET